MCAQPNSTEGSCCVVLYPVNSQYSKVCGRVIGYQFGSPNAFVDSNTGAHRIVTVDKPYLDGISITHGKPDRTHIWSYTAGATEHQDWFARHYNCPCSDGINALPLYLGSNYYCESANKDNIDIIIDSKFFPSDPLWDDQQCDNEGTCCTGANTPPWFSVDLHNPTSDDIEVRICHDDDTDDEDTPIQLLELYVQ